MKQSMSREAIIARTESGINHINSALSVPGKPRTRNPHLNFHSEQLLIEARDNLVNLRKGMKGASDMLMETHAQNVKVHLGDALVALENVVAGTPQTAEILFPRGKGGVQADSAGRPGNRQPPGRQGIQNRVCQIQGAQEGAYAVCQEPAPLEGATRAQVTSAKTSP
ncbi:hypothetical protein COU36_01005 [Candidatus Micrarchaeota archaeon CG10_big_fil_rev_8_21_14_0_10_59_7]|nr:MAG: hypothetical protein COU36_01005 [Candidatus Micrarchaeota archaeon CG10_big_fil_rev_8_21_14_0_10_59_7]